MNPGERGSGREAAARASAGDGADGAPRPGRALEGERARAPVVLVVEDDADLRDALCLVIGGSGWRALGAANGLEGLALVREGLRPAAIVLDLVMPTMDGWRFAAELRRHDRLAPIPLVVISSAWNLDARRTADIGPREWLLKPLDFRKLLAALARVAPPSLAAGIAPPPRPVKEALA